MPQHAEPKVYLVGSPFMHLEGMEQYLREAGGEEQMKRWEEEFSSLPEANDAEMLTEAAGRICYRSWAPGLNPNVTRIRDDREAYLRNILASGHGSVIEHANFSFVFRHVSRVFTHELVRHKTGTAVSQESMRFVRLDKIPFWMPDWANDDDELFLRCWNLLSQMEAHQEWMARHFGLDSPEVPFAEKKAKTSFMRRFAPDGVATDLLWTCNVRELRHVVAMRTDPAAEEEIRLVFGKVAEVLREEIPFLFQDFTEDDGTWSPEYRKV